MKGAAASLAAAILAFGLVGAPGAAKAQQFYASDAGPIAWLFGPGTIFGGGSGLYGYLWGSPPYAVPIPAPSVGCYVTREHLTGAWRRVEVCY